MILMVSPTSACTALSCSSILFFLGIPGRVLYRFVVLKELSLAASELFYGCIASRSLMRLALKFAYNGKQFSGYARQPHQRTVEGELIQLLKKHGIIDNAKGACFRTASRTDRGVSALGNVCAFDVSFVKDSFLSEISDEQSVIFIYGMQQVESGFYPRHAKQRQYRYYLRKDTLDVDAILSTAALFTGEHDFRNFARVEPGKNPIRIIDAIVIEEDKTFFIIDFYAQTFLWNQIRRMISALQKVGAGKLLKNQVHTALAHPENRVDFQLASPEPLLLKDVLYDFSFKVIKNYTKKLSAFEERIVTSL
jgi:tRNA pseudouridine38-40 synthase